MYTVEAATRKSAVTFHSGHAGRTNNLKGFAVCSSPGRATRWFMQGSAQKWTPALEQDLRKKAEDWAKTLNEWAAKGR